jgi:hypothetical protein
MKIGIVAAVSVLLVVGLAGCAAPATNGVASVNQPTSKATTGSSSAKKLTPTQMIAAGIKFATCMRAHGIQMDDPTVHGGSFNISINGNYSNDKVQAAQKVCGKYLPPRSGPNSGGPSAQGQADLLKYSACMRAHGVKNFPDPSSDGGFQIDGSKLDVSSPTFHAADKTCHPQGGGQISQGVGGDGPSTSGGNK